MEKKQITLDVSAFVGGFTNKPTRGNTNLQGFENLEGLRYTSPLQET